MANDQPERIDGFLRAELTIDPSDLLMDLMPGEGANRRQPKQVQFVLKVTNSSRTDYSTEHENSEIFRFWVSDARGNEVWRSPGTSLQVITPVRIDAGASTEGKGIWQIEDVRKLTPGDYTGYGEFVPTNLRADAESPSAKSFNQGITTLLLRNARSFRH